MASADAQFPTAGYDAALRRAVLVRGENERRGPPVAALVREDIARQHRFVVCALLGMPQTPFSDQAQTGLGDSRVDWRWAGLVVPLPPDPSAPDLYEVTKQPAMSSTVVPAVSYSLLSSGIRKGGSTEVSTGGAGPAAMGSGPAWTAEEDQALALCAREVQEDPIVGTDQMWDEMIAAIFEASKARVGVNRFLDDQELRRERAVDSRLWLMQNAVQNFKNVVHRVEKKNWTGNLTDEDMIRAAVAEWCAVNVCDSIHGDRAADVRRGKGNNRKPKQVHFPFLECR